jgi:hypothetical protein
MISDQNRLTEGMGSFLGGANSAVDPALISENQYSWGENIVVRDGFPKTRPGFKFIKLLPPGVVQGACYFTNRIRNTQDLIALINGKLYDLSPLEASTQARDISPAGETSPLVSQKASLVQANAFLVLQDGTSPAIVYDGATSFRSQGKTQLASPAVTITDAVLGANNNLIAVPNVVGIEVGMLVASNSGAVQDETFVTSFDIENSTITLSKDATRTIVTTLLFYSPGIVRDNISIPVGSIMAYGNGRLWVANNNNLFAGDLVGSSLNAEIKFTETIYLTGGGSFYFNENITGLVFLPGQDNSVGQGDLIVFTQNAIYAVKATNYDRTTWQTTPGMQRKIFIGRGSENQESIILTDKDVYFRSLEGMRSLAQTLNARGVVSLSDSLEGTRVMAYDTERWLTYTPGTLFDSRYLLGGAPKIQRITDANGNYTGRFNIVFSKIVSKDFNAGSVLNAPVPVFDGEWNGFQICKLVEGTFDNARRCFAITCDPDGKNCLYEVTLADYADEIKPSRNAGVVTTPIECSVETKRFSFGTPFDIKTLMRADVGFTDVYGDVTWDLKYSPDFVNLFYSIQEKTIPNEQETPVLTTQSPPNLPYGFRTVRTVKPESVCLDLTNRLSNFGYMFQAKLYWEGQAKLALFRLHASRKDISDLGECE